MEMDEIAGKTGQPTSYEEVNDDESNGKTRLLTQKYVIFGILIWKNGFGQSMAE